MHTVQTAHNTDIKDVTYPNKIVTQTLCGYSI